MMMIVKDEDDKNMRKGKFVTAKGNDQLILLAFNAISVEKSAINTSTEWLR